MPSFEFLEDVLARLAAEVRDPKDAKILRDLSEVMTRYNVQDVGDLRSYLQKDEDES